MLMVASGDSAQYEQNLIDAGAPQWLSSTISKIPSLALNFRIWLLVVIVLLVIAFIDWKFPHKFPRRLRRVKLSSKQKAAIKKSLKNASAISIQILQTKNLVEKNDMSEEMLAKIDSLRHDFVSMTSGRFSEIGLKFCRHAEQIYRVGQYNTTDYKKMSNTKDKLISIGSRITD